MLLKDCFAYHVINSSALLTQRSGQRVRKASGQTQILSSSVWGGRRLSEKRPSFVSKSLQFYKQFIMNFNNSVDEKNGTLLKELLDAGIEINFKIKENMNSWGVRPTPQYEIVAPNGESNPEMLAHELLHIKMKETGFLNTNDIESIFNAGNCRFMSSEISNIQNNLQHMRMLPMFVEMGYPADKFVANHGKDYFSDLVPTIAINAGLMKLHKNTGTKPPIALVTSYLNIAIALKSQELEQEITANRTIDIEELKDVMREADRELFDTLYEHVTLWVEKGGNNNYSFYNNINYCLYNLGYPPEYQWEEWLIKP